MNMAGFLVKARRHQSTHQSRWHVIKLNKDTTSKYIKRNSTLIGMLSSNMTGLHDNLLVQPTVTEAQSPVCSVHPCAIKWLQSSINHLPHCNMNHHRQALPITTATHMYQQYKFHTNTPRKRCHRNKNVTVVV